MTMLIFICIQLVVYCSAQTLQCKATSVSYSQDLWGIREYQHDGKLPYLALDVCNSGITNGSFISQKFECDMDGNLYEKRWFGSECLGDPYYEGILDDVFEPSLIGTNSGNSYVDLDYTRNLNKSECSRTKNCDYTIVKMYEDCEDDYLEQAWVMNECVITSNGTSSCQFVCKTTSSYETNPSIWLYCYESDNCGISGIRSMSGIMIVADKMCRMNDINNISYSYEIGCDAYIAPSTTTAVPLSTTTSITMTTNSNILTETYNEEESKWSDMWIIAIVFIILVIAVLFIFLIQRRNVKKGGYTKTDVADSVPV